MMAERAVRVAVDRLVAFMVDCLVPMGIPREDAKIITDILTTADL
jgi:LDH2 family malate/lactate/ureidoglycolate dehydrogenase